MGRFINRDPIEEAGGLNLYGFCGNDAIDGVDYEGYSRLTKFLRKITDAINSAVGHLEHWLGKRTDSTVHFGAGDGANIGVDTSGTVSFNGNPIGGNAGAGGSTLKDGGNGVLIDTTTGKGTQIYGTGSAGSITVDAPGFEAAATRVDTLYGGQWWLLERTGIVTLHEQMGMDLASAERAYDAWGDSAPGMYGLQKATALAKAQLVQYGKDAAINFGVTVATLGAGEVVSPLITEMVTDAVTPEALLSTRAAETNLDWSIISKTGETRAEHVALHEVQNLEKASHGVFYGDSQAAINEAWSIAQKQGIKPISSGGVDVYVIPRPNAGFAGGYAGQGQNLDMVTIITQKGTNKIITGYPGNGMPFPTP